MFRKIVAAILRFIHEQELLLKLAAHLERTDGEPVQEGEHVGAAAQQPN